MAPERPAIRLPLEVMTTTDLSGLVFELGQLNNYFLQAKLRGQGQPTKEPPKLSTLMAKLVEVNQLNLMVEADRLELTDYLSQLKQSAPRLQISFAAEPGRAFLGRLIEYLRGNLHPLLLITVGIQPSIGVGCRLRTTNRLFDLSLAGSISQKADILRAQLRSALKVET